MSGRKKKGITFGIAGLLGIISGIVVYATGDTPDWLPMLLQGVGTIAGLFGFNIVYPDID